MIGRKAAIGLSLLCALLFSAIVVQSAAAAAATNTTAFTCVKTGTGKSTFEDAHCDKKSPTNTGNFEHEKLGAETPTKLEASNDTTGTKSNQTLKGNPFSVATHIECESMTGTATIANSEPKVGEHKISGTGTLEYTKCKVKEPAKCEKVKEPIVAKIGSSEGVEGLTGPKGEANAMGVEFKAEAGKPFAEVTLEGTCAIAGKAFPVEGSVVGTSGPGTEEAQTNKWGGATSIFTAKMTKETLKAGGKTAEYVGNATLKMTGGGNPISLTTVT